MTKAFNLKTIWIPTFILSLFLLVFYIFQVGALSRDIYLIKNYREKLNILSEKNRFLDISLSKVNSLSNIDNYLLGTNFVKPDQIKYIQILDTSVAAK